jgi:hypothetical protein
MNMVFMEKKHVSELERNGRLRSVLRDLGISKLAPFPVETMEVEPRGETKGGRGLVFMQAGLEDY